MADDEKTVLEASGWDLLDIPSPSESFFAITGHESQVLTVRLTENQSVRGEPGSMLFLTPGVSSSVSCDDCFGRCCTGEDCCVVHFTNDGSSGRDGYAALTPNFPTAKVVPVNLASKEVDGTLITQQGSFMASYGTVNIEISFDCNIMRCCCGGMGLVRQKLTGDGTVFLTSTGTMVQKVLQDGETILVDGNCLLAYSGSCTMDLRRAGGIVGMFGGGEGIFNTTVTGPGLVIVNSMNSIVFKEAIAAQKLYRR